jgi:hypothetical protein
MALHFGKGTILQTLDYICEELPQHYEEEEEINPSSHEQDRT